MLDSDNGDAPGLRLVNCIPLKHSASEEKDAINACACQPESPEQKHAIVWTQTCQSSVLSKSLRSKAVAEGLRSIAESDQRGKKTLKNPLQRKQLKCQTEMAKGTGVAVESDTLQAKSRKRQPPVFHLRPVMFILGNAFIYSFPPMSYRCD